MSNSKKAGKWPWLVVIIGALFLAMTSWAVVMAARGRSPVTDPAYYSHGLRYNQSRVEARAAEALGWTMRTELTGRRLDIFLENGGEEAVSGCSGELVLYDSGGAGLARRLNLEVREETSGVYSIDIPPQLAGNLTGDLLLQRSGVRFNRRLLLNL